MNTRDVSYADNVMPGMSATAEASTAAIRLGRASSGIVILFMLIDGTITFMPWPIVTATIDRMNYGSSEGLARCLGIVSLVCTTLYAVPPTSFVGAILMTGYLGGAMASHVRIGGPLFAHILFGFYLGLMLWGGLWLRNRRLSALLPFASSFICQFI
jgi:DoxX-like family